MKKKEKLASKLDPRIKSLWRLKYAIIVTLVGVAGGVGIYLLNERFGLGTKPYIILGVLVLLAYVVCIAVLPKMLYLRWSYDLSDGYLDIQKSGRHYVVPFIRVQDTETKQGFLLRMFNLSSVTISTAANDHVIPGLASDVAEQVRDRAAELARIAHEDV